MRIFDVETMRTHAREIFDTSVKAVDAEQCVRQFVSLDGDILRVGEQNYDLSVYNRILGRGHGQSLAADGRGFRRYIGQSHL